MNTSAVINPSLIDKLAANFGSQCIVVAIDTKIINGIWTVVTHGGRNPTSHKAIDWAKEIANRGAGEILLTSMENDGTKAGFAIDITKEISTAVSIPVIASGGAGTVTTF